MFCVDLRRPTLRRLRLLPLFGCHLQLWPLLSQAGSVSPRTRRGSLAARWSGASAALRGDSHRARAFLAGARSCRLRIGLPPLRVVSGSRLADIFTRRSNPASAPGARISRLRSYAAATLEGTSFPRRVFDSSVAKDPEQGACGGAGCEPLQSNAAIRETPLGGKMFQALNALFSAELARSRRIQSLSLT